MASFVWVIAMIASARPSASLLAEPSSARPSASLLAEPSPGKKIHAMQWSNPARPSALLAPRSPSKKIHAMQWSPHWKCFGLEKFGGFKPTCEPVVTKLLPEFLDHEKLDFVNLGMFQVDKSWQVPKGYSHKNFECGVVPTADNVKFLYNSEIWAPRVEMVQDNVVALKEDLDKHNQNAQAYWGCANEKFMNGKHQGDRVYSVMGFQRITDVNDKVIVVIGHFPHPPGGSSSDPHALSVATGVVIEEVIKPKIALIKAVSGWGNAKVVMIADLNNDVDFVRNTAFDESAAIKAAHVLVNPRAVEQWLGAKNFMDAPPMRQDTSGNAPVFKTLREALEEPNGGYIKQPIMSTEDVFKHLVGPNMLKGHTDHVGTCCADKMALVDGKLAFPYVFDRIMSDFGTSFVTSKPLEEFLQKQPAAAAQIQTDIFVGAAHMPIIAKITY